MFRLQSKHCSAEVAAALGTSEVTVRSQVSMGKARLKKWLEGRR